MGVVPFPSACTPAQAGVQGQAELPFTCAALAPRLRGGTADRGQGDVHGVIR